MEKQKKVIVITDGDTVAKKTVEVATRNLGLRCISLSAGNPTPLTPTQAVNLIMQAKAEPVVVMVDDNGNAGRGRGEQILEYLATEKSIDILGVVAVASNTPFTIGVPVDCSVTKTGELYSGTVDKNGELEPQEQHFIQGDTVDVLNNLDIPIIIGIGDIGKMHGGDDYTNGAPRTTAALKEILKRSGYLNGEE